MSISAITCLCRCERESEQVKDADCAERPRKDGWETVTVNALSDNVVTDVGVAQRRAEGDLEHSEVPPALIAPDDATAANAALPVLSNSHVDTTSSQPASSRIPPNTYVDGKSENQTESDVAFSAVSSKGSNQGGRDSVKLSGERQTQSVPVTAFRPKNDLAHLDMIDEVPRLTKAGTQSMATYDGALATTSAKKPGADFAAPSQTSINVYMDSMNSMKTRRGTFGGAELSEKPIIKKDPTTKSGGRKTMKALLNVVKKPTFFDVSWGQSMSTDSLDSLEDDESYATDSMVPQSSPSRIKPKMVKTKTMTVELAKELSRGVRSYAALSGFGQHLSPACKKVGYKTSVAADELDDFISHDWVTGRWPKFLALCFVYNSRAALITSFLVGLIISVLQTDAIGILPKSSELTGTDIVVSGERHYFVAGCWCILLCPLSFVMVLMLWQRVLCLSKCCPLVFVDKLCINQADQTLKRRGILSLAGFLKHSHRLVVMWTPRYFTRLWCTFEIASWVHLGKHLESDESILFVPVTFVQGVLTVNLGMLLFHILYTFESHFSGTFVYLVVVFVFLLLLAPVRGLCILLRDFRVLPLQLAEFSVQDSQCYCCKHDHVDPDTGEEIPCDRQLVYETLKGWFNDSQVENMSHLDAFNFRVRSTLGRSVANTVNASMFAYRDTLLMGAPILWYSFDRVPSALEVLDDEAAWRYVIEQVVIFFATFPCIIAIFLRVVLQVQRCNHKRRKEQIKAKRTTIIQSETRKREKSATVELKAIMTYRMPPWLDALQCVALSLCAMFLFALLWFPLIASRAMENPWPQIAISTFEIGLELTLFRNRFAHRYKQQRKEWSKRSRFITRFGNAYSVDSGS